MKKGIVAVVLLMCVAVYASSAYAVTELPDPDQQIPGAAAGETIAFKHDDFYVYSAPLNTALGYAGFDISTGVGQLDLLAYTGANGIDNDPVNGGFVFEDPMDAPSGNISTFSGTWGLGGVLINGPVTVDNLVNYLHTNFGPNINVPVFNFDMAQVGNDNNGGDNLFIAGKVRIIDPNNPNTPVAFWAFDGIDNNQFDVPDLNNLADPAWVLVPGLEVVESATTGFSPPLYAFNNNIGGGALDYIGVAPSMNLSLYTGQGYLFAGDFYLGGLTGSHEELFITGQFAPAGSVVPEPASMMLLCIGLPGLLGMRRKKLA